jgi:hypothetical protein
MDFESWCCLQDHALEESKKKISQAIRGRKFSDEHRNKISEALKRRKVSD